MSPHCFHETHETPEWLHGFWNITSSYIQWWVVNWWENNSWLNFSFSLLSSINVGWVCCGGAWRKLLGLRAFASLGVFCWRDITLFPVMWVIPAQETLAITELSLMYTSASPSLPQPYHGISVAGFFVVVTPPLMCVLTSSFSDGGREHFSPPEFCTLQLPPPSFISASGASHLFWLYQQQGLSGELKSV